MNTLQIIRTEMYRHKLRFKCEPAGLVMTFPVRDALLQDLLGCNNLPPGELLALRDSNPYRFEVMGLPCRAYATDEGATFDGWMSWYMDHLAVLVITGVKKKV